MTKKKTKRTKKIADDENEQSSVKEQAREKIRGRTEKKNTLVNERERLEEWMPLRERVKNIFKNYGWTVRAIVIAAGVAISSTALAITLSFKTTGKVLGNGLKEIAKEVASILPGLIGTIVSFLFRTAGQDIGLLAEMPGC